WVGLWVGVWLVFCGFCLLGAGGAPGLFLVFFFLGRVRLQGACYGGCCFCFGWVFGVGDGLGRAFCVGLWAWRASWGVGGGGGGCGFWSFGFFFPGGWFGCCWGWSWLCCWWWGRCGLWWVCWGRLWVRVGG
ncbi:hypothetical protein RA276_28255, partial [Pseudomonas syringae pv. tagetis]|uniref:hypothetical protein n=1 Tax=Pseudomonas syringae group genomosp. 7 TaxID=251699 RepID=UPI00376FB194